MVTLTDPEGRSSFRFSFRIFLKNWVPHTQKVDERANFMFGGLGGDPVRLPDF